MLRAASSSMTGLGRPTRSSTRSSAWMGPWVRPRARAARPAVETASGLAKLSYASCKDLLTRDKALVYHTLGLVSDMTMRKIENCLKTVLELP